MYLFIDKLINKSSRYCEADDLTRVKEMLTYDNVGHKALVSLEYPGFLEFLGVVLDKVLPWNLVVFLGYFCSRNDRET